MKPNRNYLIHDSQDRHNDYRLGGMIMVKLGLLVKLEAKPGMEAELENFLRSALPLAEQEPATAAWFAFRIGPATFGIFDAFPDETGRHAHLDGRIAAELYKKGPTLIAHMEIENIDLLAAKLPGEAMT
jgi:quinol monooxygenase YgiN